MSDAGFWMNFLIANLWGIAAYVTGGWVPALAATIFFGLTVLIVFAERRRDE